MAFCRRHRASQHPRANKNMPGPDDRHDMRGALSALLLLGAVFLQRAKSEKEVIIAVFFH